MLMNERVVDDYASKVVKAKGAASDSARKLWDKLFVKTDPEKNVEWLDIKTLTKYDTQDIKRIITTGHIVCYIPRKNPNGSVRMVRSSGRLVDSYPKLYGWELISK
jgi:hypothetical protein